MLNLPIGKLAIRKKKVDNKSYSFESLRGSGNLGNQKQPPVIIFLTDDYSNEEAALFAARSVLFKPLVTYRTEALLDAGYENICVIDGKYTENYQPFFEKVSTVELGSSSGEKAPLKQALRFLEKHSHENVLICWADFPVTPAATLAEISSPIHADMASNEESIIYIAQEKILSALDSEEENLSDLESTFQGHQCACNPGQPEPSISLAHHFLRLQSFFRTRKNNLLMDENVYLLGTDGVFIHPDAKIGKGTIIHPGTIIKEGVVIGENCEIGPNTLIERCTVGDHTILNESQFYDSTIGNHVKIGPYCHIRPNSILENGVQLGDFVEIKNATIGEETHVSHLTYIGDSDFGKRINVGCGVVVVNYDGQNKHRTTVGDGAFIGCNTNLVSPVHLGDGAYTAAGSTITEDIPEMSLGIARARQENKLEWAKGKYKKQ